MKILAATLLALLSVSGLVLFVQSWPGQEQTSRQDDLQSPRQVAAVPGSVDTAPFAAQLETPFENPVRLGDEFVLLPAIELYPQLKQIIELEDRIQPLAESSVLMNSMLEDPDPVIRLAALESVAASSGASSMAAIRLALNDSEPLLRITAIEAFAMRMEKSTAMLIEPLAFDSDRQVRIAAIDTLADLDNPQVIATLGGLIFDQDPVIRRHALHALAEIGGEQALLYIGQLRHDPIESVRNSALAVLAPEEPDQDW